MIRARFLKMLVLFVSTLICVLLVEATVRIARPQVLSVWSHTKDGLVIHRRNLSGHLTPHGKRIDTNSVGMRDGEHGLEKPPQIFRIILFGDSFMEARQVDWEDTLAHRLSRYLNEASETEIEVINASVSGWGTDDQLTYYLRHAKRYSPDLILVGMTLHNDVSDNLLMEFHSLKDGRLIEKEAHRPSQVAWARQRVQEWFASNSHLYWLVMSTLRARSVRTEGAQLNQHVVDLLSVDPSRRLDAGWEMTYLLLDKLRETAAGAGSDLALFLIPLAIQVTDERLDGFIEDLDADRSALALTRPQEIMADWGASRDVMVVDLMPKFRTWARENRADPYLTVDGHWNEDGHALAADVVGDELIRSKLVPGKPTTTKE